jgi:hypothetical protein
MPRELLQELRGDVRRQDIGGYTAASDMKQKQVKKAKYSSSNDAAIFKAP